MKELAGKVAVVTGGGSGIGRGMALAFADAGMKVAIADVEPDAGERVCAELAARGVQTLSCVVDVRDRASLEALAEKVYAELGATHVLCNNAGVTTFGPLDATSDEDWEWVLGVNLQGVVNGLQAFLPRMKRQDGEKHVVNTASMAGVAPFPTLGPYVASKYAVVGISETLQMEGREWGLSCSVLCPGNVSTGIVKSARNRPESLGGPNDEVDERILAAIEQGIDPEDVGRIVCDAVLAGELYIFTHPEQRKQVMRRFDRIMAAFDRATPNEGSPE